MLPLCCLCQCRSVENGAKESETTEPGASWPRVMSVGTDCCLGVIAGLLRLAATGRTESVSGLLGHDAVYLEGGRYDVVDVVMGRGLLGQLRRSSPRFSTVHHLLDRRLFRQPLLPSAHQPTYRMGYFTSTSIVPARHFPRPTGSREHPPIFHPTIRRHRVDG